MSWSIDPIVFWIVAARYSGLAVAAPAFAAPQIPRVVRASVVLWLSVFTVPLVEPSTAVLPSLPWILGAEFACGAALGLIMRMLVAAANFSGALLDSEMGFLAANQFNPLLVESGGPFGTLWTTVAVLLVWLLDLVPVALAALHGSFRILPPGAVSTVGDVPALLHFAGAVFGSGLVLAAPVLAVCFLVTVVLGMAGRAVQGLNVFAEGFNLRLIAGGAAVVLLLPLLVQLVRTNLEAFVPAAVGWFGGFASR